LAGCGSEVAIFMKTHSLQVKKKGKERKGKKGKEKITYQAEV